MRSKANLPPNRAALMFSALGNVARIDLFRLLVRAGSEGLSVTGIQREMGIPASTLGHHVSALVAAGLVSQERRGRELICRAEFADVHLLSEFLLLECCAGSVSTRSKQSSHLAA
jgi:ArsR family transcriptional regulator, arsenate/arsenite/antimonite-responsive transcriptional repressor